MGKPYNVDIIIGPTIRIRIVAYISYRHRLSKSHGQDVEPYYILQSLFFRNEHVEKSLFKTSLCIGRALVTLFSGVNKMRNICYQLCVEMVLNKLKVDFSLSKEQARDNNSWEQ